MCVFGQFTDSKKVLEAPHFDAELLQFFTGVLMLLFRSSQATTLKESQVLMSKESELYHLGKTLCCETFVVQLKKQHQHLFIVMIFAIAACL